LPKPRGKTTTFDENEEDDEDEKFAQLATIPTDTDRPDDLSSREISACAVLTVWSTGPRAKNRPKNSAHAQIPESGFERSESRQPRKNMDMLAAEECLERLRIRSTRGVLS
jgi:hypothetical protein